MPNDGMEVKLSDGEMAELLKIRRDRDILASKKPAEGEQPKPEATQTRVEEAKDRQLQKAIDFLAQELAKAS